MILIDGWLRSGFNVRYSGNTVGFVSRSAETWLNEEQLFDDLGKIQVPTLILHGIHDKVCLFPLAVAQNKGITNSRLVPFEYSGHGLFYDERDKFNRELSQFIEE